MGTDFPALREHDEKKPRRRRPPRDGTTNCYQVKGPNGDWIGGHHPSCPFHESQTFKGKPDGK